MNKKLFYLLVILSVGFRFNINSMESIKEHLAYYKKQRELTKAFLEAAQEGNLEEIKYLINQGVDPNIKGPIGNTALFEATKRNHENIVLFLLEKDANPNKQEALSKITPLMNAALNGNKFIVKQLLEAGADITLKNSFGETAKNIAFKHNHISIAELLSFKEAEYIVKKLNNALESKSIEIVLYPNHKYSGAKFYYLHPFEKEQKWKSFFGGRKNDKAIHHLKSLENRSTIFISKKELDKEIKNIKAKLVQNYKIHLMPKSLDDLIKILILFFERITIDEKLKKAVESLKFYRYTNFSSLENLKQSLLNKKGEILPIIVIYPASGQENAKYLLDNLIELYRDIEGANIAPRYNQKVTSLIYYAQGDADYKTDEFKEYYAEPDRIFYKSDFEGEEKDYRLI